MRSATGNPLRKLVSHASLLNLAFFKDNMLTELRVVFLELELVFALFFVSCIEIARSCGGNEANKLAAACFCHVISPENANDVNRTGVISYLGASWQADSDRHPIML